MELFEEDAEVSCYWHCITVERSIAFREFVALFICCRDFYAFQFLFGLCSNINNNK